ncbi:hypothetical protein NUL63_004569 [Salmonella enterica]|nr:hypothetical protein [Salmonella enterica]
MKKHPEWPEEKHIHIQTQAAAIHKINWLCKAAKAMGYDTPGLLKSGVFAVSALRKGADPDVILKSFCAAAKPVIEARAKHRRENGNGNFAKLIDLLNEHGE